MLKIPMPPLMSQLPACGNNIALAFRRQPFKAPSKLLIARYVFRCCTFPFHPRTFVRTFRQGSLRNASCSKPTLNVHHRQRLQHFTWNDSTYTRQKLHPTRLRRYILRTIHHRIQSSRLVSMSSCDGHARSTSRPS